MNDMLIEFWSDIENVKNAAPENIQSDILAYLKELQRYKEIAETAAERFRWLHHQVGFGTIDTAEIIQRTAAFSREASA